MCTLSIVRCPGDLVRVAFSRDELDARPGAFPPRPFQTSTGQALMPIDPQSGGTWIAANDAGVVFALLNVNPRLVAPRGRISRGCIIPALLDASDPNEALTAAMTLDERDLGPFRVVVVDHSTLVELVFDGREARATSSPLVCPSMFTSSGLGDHLVCQPRQRLFDQIFGAAATPQCAQDEFHRHRWQDRPHLSVSMIRPGARTVSRTVVEVGADRIDMLYEATGVGSRHHDWLDVRAHEAVYT